MTVISALSFCAAPQSVAQLAKYKAAFDKMIDRLEDEAGSEIEARFSSINQRAVPSTDINQLLYDVEALKADFVDLFKGQETARSYTPVTSLDLAAFKENAKKIKTLATKLMRLKLEEFRKEGHAAKKPEDIKQAFQKVTAFVAAFQAIIKKERKFPTGMIKMLKTYSAPVPPPPPTPTPTPTKPAVDPKTGITAQSDILKIGIGKIGSGNSTTGAINERKVELNGKKAELEDPNVQMEQITTTLNQLFARNLTSKFKNDQNFRLSVNFDISFKIRKGKATAISLGKKAIEIRETVNDKPQKIKDQAKQKSFVSRINESVAYIKSEPKKSIFPQYLEGKSITVPITFILSN